MVQEEFSASIPSTLGTRGTPEVEDSNPQLACAKSAALPGCETPLRLKSLLLNFADEGESSKPFRPTIPPA
jgi:hypothetical protein